MERLLILLIVAAGALLLTALLQLWRRWRLQRVGRLPLPADLVTPGQAAVLAFSSPSCGQCHTRQAPALDRLQQQVGERVTVRTLTAAEYPELVSAFGILTVPATVVVDPGGQIRGINLGYASEGELARQLAA